MSAGRARKSIQVKYKKISFKDLEFDQGDDVFVRGEFSDVKRVRWNEKVVAVKCFTSADRKHGFSEELVYLSLLQSHKHIVEMHGACVSEHPFIVLEFAPMSLEKVLHDKGKKQYRYHVEHVMSWSRQIALALEYIHSKDMLHRDVKPSNMLLFKDGLLLKLSDFGTAKKLEHTLTNAVGTIRYMAPEVIRGRNYNESCDVFSFGVVFWEMITRRRPTLGAGKGQHSNMAILYAMANGMRPPKIANIPKALSDMISKCWDEEREYRPSMNELRVKLTKLCKYVDEARPLVSKRQPKQPSQGDMFADSRHSAQHENPDHNKEEEDKDGGTGEVGRDKESDDAEVKENTDSFELPKAKADQSKKLFQEAMQSGYVVLHTIVLLLIGVAGAGKTCFCHMLFNEPPPLVRVSTPLAKSSIRANSSVRDRDLSFERATMSHREGAVFWERISVEMFNSLIAEDIKSFEGIKSFEPVTNPIWATAEVFLSASEDLQLRVVPPIEHTISAHGMYREMDRTDTPKVHSVDHYVEAVAVDHPQLSDIDQLFEMESVKQLLGMISQSKGSAELLRREWLYIIDSGGQPQFHELLPTFVRHVSAVAFFVKLNETLATRPMIEYYSKGGCLCEPYQSSQTHLQIMQNCLQAMQARCLVDNTAKCPKLFFIGTHYDLESKEEPLSNKNAQLFAILHQHDIFRKHLAYNSLGSVDQLLYPVNAQTPSTADKQVVASFRQDIIEKCQKHERQIPIRWFVLESLLQELSQHGIISFKKCLEVAGRLGMDEDRLRAAIEYLAQLNIFEFYPSVLPKIVFTTSQVLLTKVTELVEYSHLLRNRSVAHCSSDDKEFRDNGYLNVKYLQHERFSSHFISGLFEVKDLLALLEDRLVITRQSPGKFVMMAVLSELTSDKLEEHRLAISKSPTHIVPIAIHYPGSLFPAGIFTSLVSHLQTNSNWTVLMNELTGKPECLFKNCVDFMIDTDELNALATLIYTHQWIELHVQIDGDQQHACSLKRMMFDGLKHAAEVQKYSNITPELAFLCPCDHEQEASNQAGESQPSSSLPPHLATVTRNKQRIWCKLDKRFYELKEKYAVWIASDELIFATKSNTTPDYEKRSVLLQHLSLIKWKDNLGRSQRYYLMDKITHEWRTLGELLGLLSSELQSLAAEHQNRPKECCRAVLDQWFDNPPPNYPTTWQGLLELLEDSQLGQVVTELRAILDKASL